MKKTSAFIVAAYIALSVSARAATILSITGTTEDPKSTYSAGSDSHPSVSWTQTSAFTNVSITLNLAPFGSNQGTAYLTTRIGPGTTIADQVALTNFTFPTTASDVTVFTNLILGAGTYYLTLDSSTSNAGIWDGTKSPTVIADPSVTQHTTLYAVQSGSYAPALTYTTQNSVSLKYGVTGIAVPEPSSAWIVISMAILITVYRRTRLTTRSSERRLAVGSVPSSTLDLASLRR